MRVGFIVERRYLKQEITRAVVEALHRRDVRTDVICPEDAHFEPDAGMVHVDGGGHYELSAYDALVSRSRNMLGLAMLTYAEAAGVPTINRSTAIRKARNKAEVALALGPAGVPCAPTTLADRASALASLPDEWFPLILKAAYGDNSQGLRLVRRREDLLDLAWGEDVVVAQHYLPNDGFDLKLYVCGDEVFATRKPSPFNGDPSRSTQPFAPDPRMVQLARRCGQVLGLDIFGVDAIETADGPRVIEVNEFPNFTHVPGAPAHIARHIELRLVSRRCGRAGSTSLPRDLSAYVRGRSLATGAAMGG